MGNLSNVKQFAWEITMFLGKTHGISPLLQPLPADPGSPHLSMFTESVAAQASLGNSHSLQDRWHIEPQNIYPGNYLTNHRFQDTNVAIVR